MVPTLKNIQFSYSLQIANSYQLCFGFGFLKVRKQSQTQSRTKIVLIKGKQSYFIKRFISKYLLDISKSEIQISETEKEKKKNKMSSDFLLVMGLWELFSLSVWEVLSFLQWAYGTFI